MVSRETTCERVTRRVGEETNADVLELPPLFDAVDPDALDALVAGMDEGEVRFVYAGRTVTVTADGAVRVAGDSPSSPDAEPEKAVGRAR